MFGSRNGSVGSRLLTSVTWPPASPVYVMCRRGILSAAATKLLLEHGFTNVRNVRGGLTAWHYDVDQSFPLY